MTICTRQLQAGHRKMVPPRLRIYDRLTEQEKPQIQGPTITRENAMASTPGKKRSNKHFPHHLFRRKGVAECPKQSQQRETPHRLAAFTRIWAWIQAVYRECVLRRARLSHGLWPNLGLGSGTGQNILMRGRLSSIQISLSA